MKISTVATGLEEALTSFPEIHAVHFDWIKDKIPTLTAKDNLTFSQFINNQELYGNYNLVLPWQKNSALHVGLKNIDKEPLIIEYNKFDDNCPVMYSRVHLLNTGGLHLIIRSGELSIKDFQNIYSIFLTSLDFANYPVHRVTWSIDLLC